MLNTCLHSISEAEKLFECFDLSDATLCAPHLAFAPLAFRGFEVQAYELVHVVWFETILCIKGLRGYSPYGKILGASLFRLNFEGIKERLTGDTRLSEY